MKKIKSVHLAGFLLGVVVLFPMLVKGIMCNDELMLRLWSQKGITTFFRTTIVEENILKGRVLGTLGGLKFLTFISDNKYVFGAVNTVFLVAAILLFGCVAYKIWKNKRFSILLCVLILIFLPMNFEFAAPNAFVIVTLQPMILLEISLISYMNYLEDKKRKNIVLSIAIFAWAMCLYEFIITYVLLFPAIYLIKNYKNNFKWKDMIRHTAPFVIAAVVYLIAYIGQGIVFPSNYDGTKMTITSVSAVFHVLKVLFFSAFPTYYSYFNQKYRWLFHYFNNGGMKIENIIHPVMIVFIIVTVLLLIYLLKPSHAPGDKAADTSGDQALGLSKSRGREALILITALIYAVLPALPNALTPMYQNGVTTESFTSIPVSMYLYFAVMFVLTSILWRVVSVVNKKWFALAVTAVIVIGAVGNQARNQVFVKEQAANYERIVAIEDVLSLNYWKQYGSISVSAPSLYETMNSMAVEQGHWTQYAAIYGNLLNMDDRYNPKNNANMVIQNDNSFYFYYDEVGLLLTKETKSGEIALQDVTGSYIIMNLSDCVWTEGKYSVYTLDAVMR